MPSIFIEYEDGTKLRVDSDTISSSEEMVNLLFSDPSPKVLVPSSSGGTLVNTETMRSITDEQGSALMGSPKKTTQQVELKDNPALEITEVGNVFESFRKDIVGSAERQNTFMKTIVEKMVQRESLLQQSSEALQKQNEDLQEFLSDMIQK